MNKIKRNIHSKTLAGFSMIELILIIIILGIFVTMAMTRTRSGLGTIREQIAIDQITSDIDLVKAMAFGKHDTITIVFSTSQESYTIFNGPDNDRSVIGDYPNSENGVISLDNSNLREVDLQAANFNGSSELQFLPLGESKQGGSITLNTKTISVEPVTGKWTIN